jgi:hypothetical protein
MRKLLAIVLVGSSALMLNQVFAATDSDLATKMKECFQKHGQMVEKPSIRNERDCYRVHGYLRQNR